MATNRPTWSEQYERMIRWHKRIQATRPSDHGLVDDCYAFFICAFHLRDWLQADTTVPRETRNKVKDYVNGNPSLRRCADLANGAKHMIVTETPRFPNKPSRVETKRAFQRNLVQPNAFVSGALVVMFGSDTLSARTLAHDVIDAWDTFLDQHGLLRRVGGD